MANENEKKPVGNNGMFTDKPVADDLDIFDIEAARRTRDSAAAAPARPQAPANRPAGNAPALRPEARPRGAVAPARQSPVRGAPVRSAEAPNAKTSRPPVPAGDPLQRQAQAANRGVRPSGQKTAEKAPVQNTRHVSKDDEIFKQVYADSSFPTKEQASHKAPPQPVRNAPVRNEGARPNAGADLRLQGPQLQTGQAGPVKTAARVTEQSSRSQDLVRPAPAAPVQKTAAEKAPAAPVQKSAGAEKAPAAPVQKTAAEKAPARPGTVKRAPASAVAPLPDKKRTESAENGDVTAYRETAAERRAERRENARIRKSAARLQLEQFDADNSYDGYEENEMPKTTRGKRALTTLVKTLIYIAVVAIVSILAATFIINVANDVFAFVKEEKEVEITIGEYTTLNEIAEQLSDKGVIEYPNIFVLYTKIKKRDTGKYVPGTYTVSTSENYDELLSTFKEKTGPSGFTEISVTIPEGYTVDEIIDLLVGKGVGTREGFVDAIQNHDFDYWFIEELKDLNPNRKYRLEGYLYPDTYFIYKEWEEWRVINKMLTNFYNKFSIEYKNECTSLGYTVDEIINIASIIQMEAKYTSDYDMVSSVIHNRLNNRSPETGRLLQCDATIQYFLPERRTVLDVAATRIDDPYNSYIYPGLPPGPISNPTIVAIRAALYPTSSNFCFFVSQKDGHMLYARTQAEHDKNVRDALTNN